MSFLARLRDTITAYDDLQATTLDILDLPAPAFIILDVLTEHEELTASDVGSRCFLSPSRTSKLLTEMEAMRLIRREVSLHDLRVVMVSATDTAIEPRRLCCEALAAAQMTPLTARSVNCTYQHIVAAARKRRLTVTQVQVLIAVHEAGGREAGVSNLAERSGLARTTASMAVRMLVSRGLVAEASVSSDASDAHADNRIKVLRLEPCGTRCIEALADEVFDEPSDALPV